MTLNGSCQVAIEVGEHLGYVYPEALHRRVAEYVDRIRQPPPRAP